MPGLSSLLGFRGSYLQELELEWRAGQRGGWNELDWHDGLRPAAGRLALSGGLLTCRASRLHTDRTGCRGGCARAGG